MKTLLEAYTTYKNVLLETIDNQVGRTTSDNLKDVSLKGSDLESEKERQEEIRHAQSIYPMIKSVLIDYKKRNQYFDEDDDIPDEIWDEWIRYEYLLGEPMWPTDECGHIEGVQRLFQVVKSVLGISNYLATYSWDTDERDYPCDDERFETWGECYEYYLDLLDNYERFDYPLVESIKDQTDRTSIQSLKDKSEDGLLDLDFPEFMEMIKSKLSKMDYQYNESGGFPEFETDEYLYKHGFEKSVHGFATKIDSMNDYFLKIMPNNYKKILYSCWSGETDTILTYFFKIHHHFFWEKDYGKGIEIEFRILLGPKSNEGHCNSGVEWFNLKLDSQSIQCFKFDQKIKNKSSVSTLHNFLNLLEKTKETWDNLPEEFFYKVSKQIETFQFPEMGDICCKVDGDKILNLFKEYGFFEKSGFRNAEVVNEGAGTQINQVTNKTLKDNSFDVIDELFVDLGLDSGTLWCAWNLGAEKPEDYGKYYKWGEWEQDLPEYLSVPTISQIEELKDNTKHVWTEINGVRGMKFIGHNGNSIFIPSSRSYNMSSIWSSNIGGTKSWRLCVTDYFMDIFNASRDSEFPVRPVLNK